MSYLYYSTICFLLIFSIYRPFVTKLDKTKYIALGCIAFLTPFIVNYKGININSISSKDLKNNTSLYSLSQQDFTESKSSEEDIYLLIDGIVLSMCSIIIVSVCGLFSRWQLPINFVKPNANPFTSALIRHLFSVSFIAVAVISHYSFNYSTSFAFTVIGLLWYISGPYLLRRWQTVLPSTLISALLSYGICCASTKSQLSGLSFTDCAVFTCTTALVCNVFDHLDAILNMYPGLVTKEPAQVQNPMTLSYWFLMARLLTVLPVETELDPAPITDLGYAIEFLGPASRSWKTMAALFPSNLRQDLCLLYAFFRTADDLVDDAPTVQESEKNLVLIRKFLKEVFFAKHTLDWSYYQHALPSEGHLAIFRNFERIAYYLCPRAMSELTDAWEMDLRGEPVKKQKDLMNYAACISGTFGEICACLIMYKTGYGNWGPKSSPARNEEVLLRARATGQCLQLVNIARDIIADSLVGRCYVPLQYMSHPPQRTYHLLKVARTPFEVGEVELKSFAIRILGLADQISNKAHNGIDALPSEVQHCFRAAFEIYMAIGPTLRNDPGFPLRAKVPKGLQQWIAFRCIYGFRGPVVQAISSTFSEMVSIYTRAFVRISNVRNAPVTH